MAWISCNPAKGLSYRFAVAFKHLRKILIIKDQSTRYPQRVDYCAESWKELILILVAAIPLGPEQNYDCNISAETKYIKCSLNTAIVFIYQKKLIDKDKP